MKNENLIEVINKEILKLEKDLESVFDERWEFEIMGRIEALSWVLEKIKK